MSRIIASDPPTSYSQSETWPPALRALWDAASISTQRRALAYRWWLRAQGDPADTPRPQCPIQRGLYELELAYRHRSWCRGASGER